MTLGTRFVAYSAAREELALDGGNSRMRSITNILQCVGCSPRRRVLLRDQE